MAAAADVQAAFEAYQAAVNDKLAALEAAAPEDLQPVVDEITAATAALNPAPEEAPAQDQPAA